MNMSIIFISHILAIGKATPRVSFLNSYNILRLSPLKAKSSFSGFHRFSV